jgi:hypothetical protein
VLPRLANTAAAPFKSIIIRFELGRLLATPGVMNAAGDEDLTPYPSRHAAGNDLTEELLGATVIARTSCGPGRTRFPSSS